MQCRFTLFMPQPVSWRLGAQLTGMVGCLPPAAVGKPLEKRLGDRAVAFSVGFVEHPVITRGWPTAAVRSGYLRAALAGVETYWIPDHLNSLVPRSIAVPKYVGLARLVPDVDAACDPWTLLGQVAGWNRIGRLRLGVAVTDGGRRNPAVTAQAAATLHLMSRGRAILGIGVGEREGNEPYGVDWSRPVARFEEALATIRALWDSGGRGHRPRRPGQSHHHRPHRLPKLQCRGRARRHRLPNRQHRSTHHRRPHAVGHLCRPCYFRRRHHGLTCHRRRAARAEHRGPRSVTVKSSVRGRFYAGLRRWDG